MIMTAKKTPLPRRFFQLIALAVALLCSFALIADEIVWIDVRSGDEYGTGHVEGAIHIPHDEIDTGIAELGLDLDQPIYVYCRSGRRSGMAKESLESLGYTQVVNLGRIEDAQARANAEPDPETTH